MGHKRKIHRRREKIPQINTPTLAELEAKLERLLPLEKTRPASELYAISHAVEKTKRRIERMKASQKPKERPKEGSLSEFMEREHLSQEQKVQKKKDYKRQRKNRYQKERQDG